MNNNLGTLKKDYFWNTVGVFAQNAISPILLLIVTRVNGIYDSGVFSFAFSIAILFWVIAMWGGRTFQISDVNREFSHSSYVTVRLLLAVAVLLGALVFVGLNDYPVEKTAIIITLVIVKILESIADVIYGIMQVHGRLYNAGKSLVYKSVLSVVLFVVVDILTNNLLLSCAAIIVANAIFIIAYDIPLARHVDGTKFLPLKATQNVRNAFAIMLRCWPIFIVSFFSAFSLNIPRYFVDTYHNEQIAYFGIIAMPVTLIALVMTFILQPNIVSLSRFLKENQFSRFEKTVKNIIGITSLLGLVILVVSYLIGVQLLQVLFGVDFTQYRVALVVLVIGAALNAVGAIFTNLLVIARRFKAQVYILLATNILLLAACVPVVNNTGLLGAVYLYSAVNLLQVILFGMAYYVTLKGLKNAKKD